MMARMLERVWNSRARRLLTLAGVVLLIMGASAAPRLLRELDGTRVRRVEVYGTRYLAPQEALAASGIDAESSMFDDSDRWRDALRSHPLVADVRVRRRLPGTVVIEVEEVEPVALARTPELRAVDGSGRVLPLDPWSADVDAPVLRVRSGVGADGLLLEPSARRLAATLAALRREDPALLTLVSESDALPGGAVRLLLKAGGAEALLAAGDAESVRHLRLILEDLRARGDLPRVTRIDTRFRDQVVVAFADGAES